MKNLVLLAGILLLVPLSSHSDPQTSSSVIVAEGVTVYTENGYYINAKNESSRAWIFSFRYVTEGYTLTYDEDTDEQIYTLVNSTEEVYENLMIYPGEDRALFTAPVSSNRDISYWVRITEVYDAVQVPACSDRRGGA